MAEFKKVRLALKYAIRKNQESFPLGCQDWRDSDGLVAILLGVVEDFGLSTSQVTALYEEVKEEVRKELED